MTSASRAARSMPRCDLIWKNTTTTTSPMVTHSPYFEISFAALTAGLPMA